MDVPEVATAFRARVSGVEGREERAFARQTRFASVRRENMKKKMASFDARESVSADPSVRFHAPGEAKAVRIEPTGRGARTHRSGARRKRRRRRPSGSPRRRSVSWSWEAGGR